MPDFRACLYDRAGQVCSAQPAGGPIEGVDTVNEEEKRLFVTLESIQVFYSIGDLMEDAGESLIQSVYMNDTSFRIQNYTTVENVLKNDIGWIRPLDKTFFDKAEVGT